jgi:hypothetical protein
MSHLSIKTSATIYWIRKKIKMNIIEIQQRVETVRQARKAQAKNNKLNQVTKQETGRLTHTINGGNIYRVSMKRLLRVEKISRCTLYLVARSSWNFLTDLHQNKLKCCVRKVTQPPS